MGKKRIVRNSSNTLRILQVKAKEKYERALKVRNGETIEQWEKRTANSRMRYEKEFKELGVRIKKAKRVFKLTVNKAQASQKRAKVKYDNEKRINYLISKREYKFFQNSMIILSWAEMKYNISKEDFLIYVR